MKGHQKKKKKLPNAVFQFTFQSRRNLGRFNEKKSIRKKLLLDLLCGESCSNTCLHTHTHTLL